MAAAYGARLRCTHRLRASGPVRNRPCLGSILARGPVVPVKTQFVSLEQSSSGFPPLGSTPGFPCRGKAKGSHTMRTRTANFVLDSLRFFLFSGNGWHSGHGSGSRMPRRFRGSYGDSCSDFTDATVVLAPSPSRLCALHLCLIDSLRWLCSRIPAHEIRWKAVQQTVSFKTCSQYRSSTQF